LGGKPSVALEGPRAGGTLALLEGLLSFAHMKSSAAEALFHAHASFAKVVVETALGAGANVSGGGRTCDEKE